MKASLEWQQNMHFICDNDGHKVTMDASPEHGGEDKGASPKMLLLDAMMGCTAMDTISILKKMRQDVKNFTIDIEGVKNDAHPIHFKTATMNFRFEGELAPDKAIKATTKSLTQYCGVNYMVSKVCDITFNIFVNGESVHSAKAEFTDPVE
jgi:putative redox protein